MSTQRTRPRVVSQRRSFLNELSVGRAAAATLSLALGLALTAIARPAAQSVLYGEQRTFGWHLAPQSDRGATRHMDKKPAEVARGSGALRIPFVANQGQSDPRVAFEATTDTGNVFVERNGAIAYALARPDRHGTRREIVLREEFAGERVKDVKGERRVVTTANYFRGNDPSKWVRAAPAYDVVSLGEVYEGIDVELRANGPAAEKLFYVSPGARPERIRMRVKGGERLKVRETGELEIETSLGAVRFSKPVAYQESNGRQPVAVRYVVRGREYGFELGKYDETRPAIIDPFLSATFVGGSTYDLAGAVTVGPTGDVFVAGQTNSADFSGISSASADRQFVGGTEAFVARFDASLSVLLSATFLGGSSVDGANSLAIDRLGNVYLAGDTQSVDFPGVGPQSADRVLAGRYEVFVAKLNSNLSTLLGATFLGGDDFDFNTGDISLDGTGAVYVAGWTYSDDFPGIGPSSADSTRTVQAETFVAKLDGNLTSVLAATFLGGSSGSSAFGLAVDGAGHVYVTGFAYSSGFPGVAPGSDDCCLFVAKLNSGLTSVLFATIHGGATAAETIALDGTHYVYVAGYAQSSSAAGITDSSADHVFEGGSEGYVAKFDATLGTLLAATFLGGSGGNERAEALAVDSVGSVYVAGWTASSDFPGVGPRSADLTFSGDFEGFVVRLDAELSVLQGSTFAGGSGQDSAAAMALDDTGHVYVAGSTLSADFPEASDGPVRVPLNSLTGFVARLPPDLAREIPLPACQRQLVNDRVDLIVTETSGPTLHPGAPAGRFTITARLTNLDTVSILQPVTVNVVTLTNGNTLLSATEGGEHAGSKQAISVGDDNALTPGESMTVNIDVGLNNRDPFQLFVDVEGCLVAPESLQ